MGGDAKRPVFTEDATVPTTRLGAHEGARLVILGEGGATQFPLIEAGTYTIGRSSEADVCVPDASLSRLHAALTFDPAGRVSIRDLGSSNGTTLRGARLDAQVDAPVAIGEAVELGACTLLVQRGPVSPPRASSGGGVIVADDAMRALYALVDRVADSKISVLILGETGVGKEVLAHSVHARSRRRGEPFLALNCGAFTAELLESELFGYEKGAFTGAVKLKPGLLESANSGTVFLDEVGEMSLGTQVKLLRVLEERQLRRLGGLETIAFDARVIAATNRDLEAAVRAGEFREDLFYRLNGFTLSVPPLRDRKGEIVPLAEAFARQMAVREGLAAPGELTPRARRALEQYGWPGNVRELKNVIERAVLLSGGALIDVTHLPMERLGPTSAPAPARPAARDAVELRSRLGDVERDAIVAALDQCGGNQTRAAELLGISRKSLVRRLDQYELARPRKGRGEAE